MDDAAIERRLRKLARDSGFDFRKATFPRGEQNRGGYQLFEKSTNRVVAGARYELELRDVAIALQRMGVLGYGQETVR